MSIKEDRRKFTKKRSLEEVKQLLSQAQASGDKFQARIWQDVLKKLESRNDKK